jgi:alpha,alpha-trehalase
MTPQATIDPRYHDAVIFDLDGVVTDTASIHCRAWAELFDDYLLNRPAHPGEDHSPFTGDDYRQFVDGKPRRAGVADFLASRGIVLPAGERSDPSIDTVYGLGNRKQQLFLGLLAHGVPVFESTIALVRKLQDAGIGTAVFTSSRNCEQVLDAAGIGDLFTIRVDGVVADEMGLPGKPDPAVLIEAAHRLAVTPGRTVVVEDAEAGVSAGRAGGFGLVVGVDRTGHRGDLVRCGADVVVADAAELAVRTGGQRMSEVPNALEVFDQIAGLLAARRPGVFLDYDGTLSEIVSDPGAATLVEGAAEALESLAAQCPIAVISGRDLADVQARVDLASIWYAGSHGFELTAPDGSHHQNDSAAAALPALDGAATEIEDRLSDIPGIRLEHKHFALAVHYRNVAPERIDGIVAATHQLGQQHGLRVTTGRKVIELRPDIDWDKGSTVRWIMDRSAERGPLLPIYIGDDLTDEDAFDAVRADGIGIVVRHDEDGDRPTAARFALDNPSHVAVFLDRLSNALQTSTVVSGADPRVAT